MITLHTPATGFPDLEIKIAYGLARVGIEAGYEPVIVPQKGFYTVLIAGKLEKLNKTFNTVARRILGSNHIPRNTPGITGSSADTIQVKGSDNLDIGIYSSVVEFAEHRVSEKFCRHKVKEKVSNVLGFTASATTGVLCKRDGIDITLYKGQPRRPTEPRNICKTCGLLAMLGIWYSSFIFNIADKEVIVIPLPTKKVSSSELQNIFSIQHQIRKEKLGQKIPEVLIPIWLLSKIPSVSEILDGFDLFIAILSRQQGYHVDGISIISLNNYFNFLKKNSYNVASIDIMFKKKAFGALQNLNHALYYKNKSLLPKFARLYVQETSTDNWVNLLYPETTKYLLKEVAMIDSKIIENPALGSLARTLRYFIRERKYGYADAIRNAKKETKEFEETIAKMLREAELRRVQQEQDKKQGKKIENWIYIPKEEEIKEVFRLSNEDFEGTKTALVMFAFSFPSKGEDKYNQEIKQEV